jgi:hypothetical protein
VALTWSVRGLEVRDDYRGLEIAAKERELAEALNAVDALVAWSLDQRPVLEARYRLVNVAFATLALTRLAARHLGGVVALVRTSIAPRGSPSLAPKPKWS